MQWSAEKQGASVFSGLLQVDHVVLPARLEDVVEVSSSSKPLGSGPSAQNSGGRCPTRSFYRALHGCAFRAAMFDCLTLAKSMLVAAQGIWDCLAWPILGWTAASTYGGLDWGLATEMDSQLLADRN